jgi:hypothetical protein
LKFFHWQGGPQDARYFTVTSSFSVNLADSVTVFTFLEFFERLGAF